MPETVWFQDAGMSWGQILATKLDPAEKWWKYTLDIYRMAGPLAKGKYLVGGTDINAVMNILGSLRGTMKLLVDVVEEPEQVIKADEHIQRIWQQCYDTIYEMTQPFQHGLGNWMNIWGPGRFSDVQCDFSAMIGPGMFERFALPHLREECRNLDWSIYHWDGPGQIAHLDLLLDIPELTGIQWVPGAGNPGTGSPKWFDLYRRIQARGKCLVLQGMDKADVQRVAETLDPRGLLIEPRGCETPAEADDLVRSVQRWARR
jgi:5-methyltetrahydrofolate--homocysteine methyltransferase